MKENKFVNKGFTLLELAIVLSTGAIVAGAVAPSFIKSVHRDAGRKSALEVSQIQEAARVYYVKKRMWPVDLASLQLAGYLDPNWGGKNPFGKSYILEQQGQALLVKTEVVADAANVMAGLLPMSTVNAGNVASAVPVPGVDAEMLPAGALMPWPGADIPAGWMLCDGRAVSRSDHAELFLLLGVTYGSGDGATTFNLPDLRGRVVVGMDTMGGSAANIITGPWARSMGGVFGEEKHQLTIAEMPAHTHNVPKQISSSSGDSMSHADWYASEMKWGQASSPSGGGASHNNIQPSMAMNWIIKGR